MLKEVTAENAVRAQVTRRLNPYFNGTCSKSSYL